MTVACVAVGSDPVTVTVTMSDASRVESVPEGARRRWPRNRNTSVCVVAGVGAVKVIRLL